MLNNYFCQIKKMLIWATVKILTPYVDFVRSLFSISECLWTVRIDPMWGQRGPLIMSVAISSNSKFKIQFVLSIDGIYTHFHRIKPIEMNRFELEFLNQRSHWLIITLHPSTALFMLQLMRVLMLKFFDRLNPKRRNSKVISWCRSMIGQWLLRRFWLA